jgi:hypothetical protein
MRRMAVLAVLVVFCSKLSAIGIAFSAEILDADGSANERTVRVTAVLWLFCAVFIARSKDGKGGSASFKAAYDEIRMSRTLSCQSIYVNFANTVLARLGSPLPGAS